MCALVPNGFNKVGRGVGFLSPTSPHPGWDRVTFSRVCSQGTRAAQPTTTTTRRNWPAVHRIDPTPSPTESAASMPSLPACSPSRPRVRMARGTRTHARDGVEEEKKPDLGLVSTHCSLAQAAAYVQTYICTPTQQNKAPTLFSAPNLRILYTTQYIECNPPAQTRKSWRNFVTRNLGNV